MSESMALSPRISHVPYPPVTCRVKYPLNRHPSFETTAQEEKYRKLLKDNKVIPSLGVHIPTMQELDIHAEIEKYFSDSGLEELEVFCNPTYDTLVFEFLATAEFSIDDWTFRMGGRKFELTSEDLRDILGFSRTCERAEFKDCALRTFWHELTGFEDFTPNSSAKYIRDGCWKYMHRLLAINFNSRVTGGSYVTTEDLELMCHLAVQEVQMDWIRVLRLRFMKWGSTDYKHVAIGGGTFITEIAKKLGFDFDEEPSPHLLDKAAMENMQMMYAESNVWWVKSTGKPKGVTLSARKRKRAISYLGRVYVARKEGGKISPRKRPISPELFPRILKEEEDEDEMEDYVFPWERHTNEAGPSSVPGPSLDYDPRFPF